MRKKLMAYEDTAFNPIRGGTDPKACEDALGACKVARQAKAARKLRQLCRSIAVERHEGRPQSLGRATVRGCFVLIVA